jgi:hypothetical protein
MLTPIPQLFPPAQPPNIRKTQSLSRNQRLPSSAQRARHPWTLCQRSRKGNMRAEVNAGSDITESGVIAGCQWGKAEEGRETS